MSPFSPPRLVPRVQADDPLPFANDTVDAVYMEGVTAPTEVYTATALDAARALKQGGALTITTSDVESALADHAAVIKELKAKGYEVEVRQLHDRSNFSFTSVIVIISKPKG